MSDYQTNPGNGAIFKNERKEKETQPDYRGDFVTPSGEALEISLWVKTSKSGKKYFSVSVKEPYKKSESEAGGATTEEDDDLPF